MKQHDWIRTAAILALTVTAGGSALGGAPGVTEDEATARLQALLASQAERIGQLELQVAATAQVDVGQERIDAMRQQIRELLDEQEFRESLMPTVPQAGYEDSFFIRSSDDKFRMQFNGLLQFRFTHYGVRRNNRYLLPGFTRSDRTGFDVQRAELAISGHMYTEDLAYNMEFSSNAPDGYDTVLAAAWVNYRFCDAFQFTAGYLRIANMRSNFMWTPAVYQSVDNPLADAVFALGDGLGVRFWGKLLDGQGAYWIDVVNSAGAPDTQTITNDEDLYDAGHDNVPVIAFRTQWAILGGQCLNPADSPEFVVPCDMAWHTEPALNVGFHYAFIEDDHDGTLAIPFPRRTFFHRGGFGLTSSDGLQMHQFGVDAMFKCQGFSASAEYVLRTLDVRQGSGRPYTPLYQMTGDSSTNAQHGAYVQCGYFLPIPGWEQKFEIVGRVGGVSVLSGKQEGTWEYAAGLNYYIEGQNVKLQTDLTKITELPISSSDHSLANVNDDALIWRVQLQLAF